VQPAGAATTNADGSPSSSTSAASTSSSSTSTASTQAGANVHTEVAAASAAGGPPTTVEQHLPADLSSFDKQANSRVPIVLVLVCVALFILAMWRSAATRAALPPEQRRNPDLD
jgi:hypothetical protein